MASVLWYLGYYRNQTENSEAKPSKVHTDNVKYAAVDIKYDIVGSKSNSNAYKNQQIFVLIGVIKFQLEFGVVWNDKCMLILKNGQNQISWGDNSYINYHKINSDICLQ